MPPRREIQSEDDQRRAQAREAARESMDTAPETPLTDSVPGGRYFLEDGRTMVNANGEAFDSKEADEFREEEQARLDRQTEYERQAEERREEGDGTPTSDAATPGDRTAQPSTGPLT